MERLSVKSARLEFALRAQITSEQRQRLMMEMNTRLRAEQGEGQKEKQRRQDAEFFAAMEAAFAPRHKIEQFTVKLDRHDAATVQALMDNERELLEARKQIREILERAHKLPDGRRVFKTEDNQRVFDEFGAEVSADIIVPADIDDRLPRHETFLAKELAAAKLDEERQALFKHQALIDKGRERSKDPTLTESEVDALDKELGSAAPERIRKLLGEPAQAELEAKVTATTALDAPRQEPRPSSPPANVMQPL